MSKAFRPAAAVAILALLAILITAAANTQLQPKPTGVAAVNTTEGHILVSWRQDAVPVHRVAWTNHDDFLAAQAADDWMEAFHYADSRHESQYPIKYLQAGQQYWIIVGSTNQRFGAASWAPWLQITTTTPDASCEEVQYDRDEWTQRGDYPAADPDATPTWTKPSDEVNSRTINTNHHVAIHDAHLSGGCHWTMEAKRTFSSDGSNLNPTTTSFSSSKSDRTPDRLTGIAAGIIDTDAEQCAYATQHQEIKQLYDLSMTVSEHATVADWLALCPSDQ